MTIDVFVFIIRIVFFSQQYPTIDMNLFSSFSIYFIDLQPMLIIHWTVLQLVLNPIDINSRSIWTDFDVFYQSLHRCRKILSICMHPFVDIQVSSHLLRRQLTNIRKLIFSFLQMLSVLSSNVYWSLWIHFFISKISLAEWPTNNKIDLKIDLFIIKFHLVYSKNSQQWKWINIFTFTILPDSFDNHHQFIWITSSFSTIFSRTAWSSLALIKDQDHLTISFFQNLSGFYDKWSYNRYELILSFPKSVFSRSSIISDQSNCLRISYNFFQSHSVTNVKWNLRFQIILPLWTKNYADLNKTFLF